MPVSKAKERRGAEQGTTNIPELCLLIGTTHYKKCATCPLCPEAERFKDSGGKWCKEWLEANPKTKDVGGKITDEELKGKIAAWVDAVYEDGQRGLPRINVCDIAKKGIWDDIRQAGYVKLSENQELPENPDRQNPKWRKHRRYTGHDEQLEDTREDYYDKGQQDMLKQGWKKVEL